MNWISANNTMLNATLLLTISKTKKTLTFTIAWWCLHSPWNHVNDLSVFFSSVAQCFSSRGNIVKQIFSLSKNNSSRTNQKFTALSNVANGTGLSTITSCILRQRHTVIWVPTLPAHGFSSDFNAPSTYSPLHTSTSCMMINAQCLWQKSFHN